MTVDVESAPRTGHLRRQRDLVVLVAIRKIVVHSSDRDTDAFLPARAVHNVSRLLAQTAVFVQDHRLARRLGHSSQPHLLEGIGALVPAAQLEAYHALLLARLGEVARQRRRTDHQLVSRIVVVGQRHKASLQTHVVLVLTQDRRHLHAVRHIAVSLMVVLSRHRDHLTNGPVLRRQRKQVRVRHALRRVRR